MIIHRRGHNFKSVGAISILNEVEECNKINNSLSKYLNLINVKHLDVSPSDLPSKDDIKHGVMLCNKNKGDLFLSIHMNSSSSKVKRALGSEIWVYSDENNIQAKRVLEGLEKLGFKNRGIKVNKGFYELKYTNCKSMIIEVCFVNSEEDSNLYKKVGYDKIARVIAEGITGKEINDNKLYQVVTQSYKNKENAIEYQEFLKTKGIPSFLQIKE